MTYNILDQKPDSNSENDYDIGILNEIGPDFEGFDIKDLVSSDNIAEMLSEKEKNMIANIVMTDLEEDEKSMANWLRYADQAMKLTSLHREERHIPFRHAANIKYPLITTAVVQFTSRFLPEFIKNGEIVKCRIIGNDDDNKKYRKGKRQEIYINWKLLEDSPGYLDNKERFIQQLAVVGTSFVKTFWNEIDKRVEVSCIPYDRLIVNMGIEELTKAPRISEFKYYETREIIEYIRHDLFCPVEMARLKMDRTDIDAITHELIEQHRYLDLDNDGYPEPYICTVHAASRQLLRIVARFDKDGIEKNKKGLIKRIQPYHFYVDYHFLPSIDGSFFGLGFGTLLLDATKTCNTILNQLINAGHLATTQGGFIGKDLKIRKEDLDVQPGEWVPVESSNGGDIKNNIVPFDYKEPSNVLFSLLQMLTQAAQNLTSTTDSLTGTADTTNTSPNTLLMLIQQGLKVYSAIQRRIMRSIDREVEKVTDLIAMNLDEDEYLKIVNPNPQDILEMYDPKSKKLLDWSADDINIVPVSDINATTEAEKLVRSSAELQVAMQIQQIAPGVIDMHAIATNQFEALESSRLESLVLPKPDPNQPNPAVIDLQSKIDERGKKLMLDQQKVAIKAQEVDAKTRVSDATAMNQLVDAEVKKHSIGLKDRQLGLQGQQQAFNQTAQVVQANLDHHRATHQMGSENQVPQAPQSQDSSDDDSNTSQGGQAPSPPLPPPAPPGALLASPMNPQASSPMNPNGMLQQLAQQYSPSDVVKEIKRRGLLK